MFLLIIFMQMHMLPFIYIWMSTVQCFPCKGAPILVWVRRPLLALLAYPRGNGQHLAHQRIGDTVADETRIHNMSIIEYYKYYIYVYIWPVERKIEWILFRFTSQRVMYIYIFYWIKHQKMKKKKKTNPFQFNT